MTTNSLAGIKSNSNHSLRLYYLSSSVLPSRSANSVHVMKMCQAFAQQGCAVTLFAQGISQNRAEIFNYYGVPELFHLVLADMHYPSPLRVLNRLNEYRRAMNTFELPDLVYGRDIVALLCLAQRRCLPFVFEAHHPPTSWLLELVTRQVLHSDFLLAVVTISERLRQEYLRRYPFLNPDNVYVCHDGADLPAQVESITLPYSKTSIAALGYVGSLYQGRGIEIILELARRLTNVDVHLVGGSDEAVATWRAKFNYPNVWFHGHVPYGKIPSWLAAFDVLLAPYQKQVKIGTGLDTVDWMSPLKIFEYMAAAKPIIASDLPVLQEVLCHKSNSLLVPPDDVDGWCRSVELLLGKTQFAINLAKQAQEDLLAFYSWYSRANTVLKNLGINNKMI